MWFVELAPLASPDYVPQTVAAALGVAEQSGVPIEQTLVDWLKAKRLLLILDNCEHLLLACSQLAEKVLLRCPRVQILASSREGLSISGETTFRVPSLTVPDAREAQSASSLMQFESVQLFALRATHMAPGFVITDQNAPAVASVCSRLDGIPLAIELAAARLRSMTVEEVNERLDDRFRLLTGGARTALPRQQTLRSLIDWSYNLLSDVEKTLLCRLTVFAGGWTLDLAIDICAGAPVEESVMLDLLTSLCDKDLVVAEMEGDTTRYRMLETIAQYARDALLLSGEGPSWRDRHLGHYCALAASRGREAHSARGPQEWIARFEADIENIRSALTWSLSDERNAKLGLTMMASISRFWFYMGYFAEAWNWLTSFLALTEGSNSAERRKILRVAGHTAKALGNYELAAKLAQESVTLCMDAGDLIGLATSHENLGILAGVLGEFDFGRAHFRRASPSSATVVARHTRWRREFGGARARSETA